MLRDLPVRAAVINWSDGGIGFCGPAPLGALRPGHPIEARLVCAGQTLGSLDLLVRHSSGGNGQFRIGAEIRPHASAWLWRAGGDEAQVAYPIVDERDVASFYRTLFRVPECFQVRGTGRYSWLEFQIAPKGVLARPSSLELLCPLAADLVGLDPGASIDLLVLAFGSPFLVQTELMAIRPDRLVLSLPGRLSSLARREGARVNCQAAQPCFLTLPHPVDPDRVLRFRVHDLSAVGLSLRVEDDLPVAPGPMRGAKLQVPFRGEIDADLVVLPLRLDAEGTLLPARFTRLAEPDRCALVEHLLLTAFPQVYDRGRFDPWGVWEFLRSAGYPTSAAAGARPPTATWDLVRRAGASVSHDVVQVADGAIVGHLSCLRIYRRTWLVHQVAVSPDDTGLRSGALLYDYAACFLDTRQDEMGYMIAYFNQALPWHRMFFAGFERRMADPDMAVIHPFRRHAMDTRGVVLDRVSPRFATEIVDEKTVGEAAELLREALPKTALCALDLDEAALLGEEVASRFADRGLQWKRIVLAQHMEGRLIAVAVCELASPGLNAFGLTDAAKLVCRPLRAEDAVPAHRALLARVKAFYLAHGREQFVLLLDRNCSDEAIEAAGGSFVEATGFVAMTRAGVQNFRSFVRYEMARLRELGSAEAAASEAPEQAGDASVG